VSPLWLIPGAVVVLGGAVILALLRSAGEEAKLLAEELARQRQVGAAVHQLGDEVRRVQRPGKGRR
jgi:hypothetical protein